MFPETAPFDVKIHDMELTGVPVPPLQVQGKTLPETAVEEEEEGGRGPAQTSDWEITAEEQEVMLPSDVEKGLL